MQVYVKIYRKITCNFWLLRFWIYENRTIVYSPYESIEILCKGYIFLLTKKLQRVKQLPSSFRASDVTKKIPQKPQYEKKILQALFMPLSWSTLLLYIIDQHMHKAIVTKRGVWEGSKYSFLRVKNASKEDTQNDKPMSFYKRKDFWLFWLTSKGEMRVNKWWCKF